MKKIVLAGVISIIISGCSGNSEYGVLDILLDTAVAMTDSYDHVDNNTNTTYADYKTDKHLATYSNKNGKMVNTIKKNYAKYEYKYYPAVNECVDRDTSVNYGLLKNKCSFGIAVWFCNEKDKYGCSSGSKRFNHLTHISPYSRINTLVSPRHDIRWFACGASGKSMWKWSIANNKKNATKFGCKISERK